MEKKENPVLKKILFILSLFMITIFFGMGFLFLYGWLPFDVPASQGKAAGALLLIYGCVRAFRAYKQYRDE